MRPHNGEAARPPPSIQHYRLAWTELRSAFAHRHRCWQDSGPVLRVFVIGCRRVFDAAVE